MGSGGAGHDEEDGNDCDCDGGAGDGDDDVTSHVTHLINLITCHTSHITCSSSSLFCSCAVTIVIPSMLDNACTSRCKEDALATGRMRYATRRVNSMYGGFVLARKETWPMLFAFVDFAKQSQPTLNHKPSSSSQTSISQSSTPNTKQVPKLTCVPQNLLLPHPPQRVHLTSILHLTRSFRDSNPRA
jgi:hypothetical protein